MPVGLGGGGGGGGGGEMITTVRLTWPAMTWEPSIVPDWPSCGEPAAPVADPYGPIRKLTTRPRP